MRKLIGLPTAVAMAIGLSIGWLAAPPPILAQSHESSLDELMAKDYYYQHVYGDLAVASMRLRDGDFVAYILIDGETRAAYELSVLRKTGKWRIFGASKSKAPSSDQMAISFDYRQARVADFDGDVGDLLARHNTLSVALSAVLLWEDYQDGRIPAIIEPAPEIASLSQKTHLPVHDPYGQCTTCTPAPNGCTAVPDNCPPFSTSSIRESCQEHDRCYQCGDACFGHSRYRCDRDLRTNISFQTNAACAWAYFLGVRLAGWLFYQTASGGIGMMHDVYSLGVTISACEGQYQHMCTVYVF